MMKAPRLAKFEFLLLLLSLFLIPNVFADGFFRQTDGADAVPARPKVVAREVVCPTQVLPMDPDRRLPLSGSPPWWPR